MIDDDARLAQFIESFLTPSGFAVTHATTGRTGMDWLANERNICDLVLLNLVLPDIDGIEICRQIRSLKGPRSKASILVLSENPDPMGPIIALDSGADDYLRKPLNPHELLARIKAILRRRGQVPGVSSQILRFGSLEIDQVMRCANVGGRPCKLTQSQFDVLVALALQAGKVLTRGHIMTSTDYRTSQLSLRAIDVQIWRIRQAIETDAKMPKRIITVNGAGYLFVKQQD